MTNLPQLRISLAAARVTLRNAKDELETAKAIAETNMINNGAAGGKNAEERARALTVALEGSTLYRDALSYLRESEALIDQLQAEIANEEDRMRADELRVREKLADALIGRRKDNAIADILTIAKTALHTYQQHGDYQGNTPDVLRDIVQTIEKETTDWYEVQNEADRRRIAAMESDYGEPDPDPNADHMSHGDPNSDYYAGKPRPKPNYAMLADGELPY